ncbi:MAG TPA: hypothetical protein DD740_00440 [Chryseobacterium sp.]|nr:hypothetical protein [Chryseobacterium sp.]
MKANFENIPPNHNGNTSIETTATGENGILKVNENTIELIRKGLTAKLIGLRGTKEIMIKDITSIQLKEPGFLTNGFIQFAFPRSQESKAGTFDAAKDENSIIFNKKQKNQFIQIRNLINDKRKNIHNQANQLNAVSNQFDDLEKLAGLRDKGIISDEEFTIKKKQILGL